jgi:hypothetical protein
MARGSRKHVLDWTNRPTFVSELIELVKPVNCRVTAESQWQPRGHSAPAEARLDRFGPRVLPAAPWGELKSWWLKHPRRANTPNWDIALSCEVEGHPGLILVEAKANVPELSHYGKPRARGTSKNSTENHQHIGSAIRAARDALKRSIPDVAIERDRYYQLSNRIAFSWKLASLGIPTVLVYLGFVGDVGIKYVGAPFSDAEHWHRTFRKHLQEVCPVTILDAPVHTGNASFWVLSRTLPVLEHSVRPVV